MKLTYDGHMISSFRTFFIYLYALAIIYDISKPVIWSSHDLPFCFTYSVQYWICLVLANVW